MLVRVIKQLKSQLQSRGAFIGISVTWLILLAYALGWMDSLENWFYDLRANDCQFFAPAPTKDLVHLDIDDAALVSIGRWPWPRATMARILDEIALVHPRAVGMDILFSEPQEPRYIPRASGSLDRIDDDAILARSISNVGHVALATSFSLIPDEQTTGQPMMVRWLEQDLEMPLDAFTRKLRASRMPASGRTTEETVYLTARRSAMRNRIAADFRPGRETGDQLFSSLLPHTNPHINTPLKRLFEDELAEVDAEYEIKRFGAPLSAIDPPPVHGTLNVIPIPTFSEHASTVGFTNYDIFDAATVRSIPLLVENDNRLYPQMGLAIACQMLGVDPARIRVEGSTVVLPRTMGDIRIPTYNYSSKSLGRQVALILPIPWFGTHDWETMYDWPNHQAIAGHYSINLVWDSCQTQDRIVTNNATIDDAISMLLSDSAGYCLALDPPLAKRYAAALPAPQDIASRQKMADTTLKELKESGWIEQYASIAEKDLKPDERIQRDNMLGAQRALRDAESQNEQLSQQLAQQRAQIAQSLGNKGILIGYTATGFFDRVATSLHTRCPGVVVHGVVANAILTQRFWRLAPTWVMVFLTVLFGMAVGIADASLSPTKAAVCAAILGVGYWLINGLVLFNTFRIIVGVVCPIMAVVAVWAICTFVRLIARRARAHSTRRGKGYSPKGNETGPHRPDGAAAQGATEHRRHRSSRLDASRRPHRRGLLRPLDPRRRPAGDSRRRRLRPRAGPGHDRLASPNPRARAQRRPNASANAAGAGKRPPGDGSSSRSIRDRVSRISQLRRSARVGQRRPWTDVLVGDR